MEHWTEFPEGQWVDVSDGRVKRMVCPNYSKKAVQRIQELSEEILNDLNKIKIILNESKS